MSGWDPIREPTEQETVADQLAFLDGQERERKAAEAAGVFVPATLDGTPELPAPGIYFGMPEEVYHALPALSCSGINKVSASPMIFWAATDWLNKAKREAEAVEDRIHQTLGKAYHCRIMEGREQYDARFCVGLSEDEVDGALVSTDQIKAAINAFGVKPHSKVPDNMPDGSEYMRAAKKDDWIAQLLALDPDARILSVLEADHRALHNGKTFISAEDDAGIQIAARMVEQDPEIRYAFQGGYAEVTLIWYCARTGVPMKARVDYLKRDVAVDLKSIANQREQSMENAIRLAIAGFKYALQPGVYAEGIKEVRRLLRRGEGAIVIDAAYPYPGAAVENFVDRWSRSEKLEWLWVFQQKGDAPITRALSYPMQGTTKLIFDDTIARAKKVFRKFSETYGTDPWLDVKPIYDLADEDLPPYATEI